MKLLLALIFICSSYDKNLPTFSLTDQACRPESLRQQVKEYLEHSYILEFKKFKIGSEREAKETAKQMFKTYKCEWK